MKKISMAMLLIICILGTGCQTKESVPDSDATTQGEKIVFQSKVVEEKIKSILGKDEVFAEDMSKIEELSFSFGEEVKNLNFLEYCPSLRSLELNGNETTDISGLKYTPKLETLKLADISINSINVLEYTSELKELYLRSMPVRNISVLEHTPKLKDLSLNNVQVSDINVLKYTPELESLWLGGVEASDISVLEYTPKLKELSLSYAPVNDISVLKYTPELKELYLFDVPVSDISVLEYTPQLESLGLEYVQVSDISAVAYLHQLKSIQLIGTEVTDISAIAKTKSHFEEIVITDSDVKDISPLADYDLLNGAKELILRNNKIEDISAFENIKPPFIKKIRMENNFILDFTPFKKMCEKAKDRWGVFVSESFKVMYDGEQIKFDTPISYHKTQRYVNAKNLIESLGGTYSFDKAKKEITMQLNGKTIVMKAEEDEMLVNGKKKSLEYEVLNFLDPDEPECEWEEGGIKDEIVLPMQIMQWNTPYIPIEIVEEFGYGYEVEKENREKMEGFEELSIITISSPK